MASMRNGQGDAWFCVFSDVGVFLKGFDHESQMSPCRTQPPHVWRGVLDELPEPFKPFATEPALSMADTTFASGAATMTKHGGPAISNGHQMRAPMAQIGCCLCSLAAARVKSSAHSSASSFPEKKRLLSLREIWQIRGPSRMPQSRCVRRVGPHR